jgi:RNA polymerase sigma-70 factor, ECF subfamily
VAPNDEGGEDEGCEMEGLFLRALPEAAGRPAAGAGQLGPRLAQMLARARAAWPRVPLAAGAFAEHVARRISASETSLVPALEARHAEDLYLACACATGVPGAIEALSAHFRAAIDAAIARVDASPTFVDEVRQVLHHRLFLDGDDQPGRIASYHGRGPLAGWLAITAQRTALNVVEHEAARDRMSRRAGAEQLEPELDPELRFVKQKYTVEFEKAFIEALDHLSARDRTLLGLKVVSGLTLDRIGLMYQVDTSTASRWIAAARQQLTHLTEGILTGRLGVSRDEMQSLARLVASQVDVSIARLLAPPGAPPDGGGEDEA